MIATDRAFGTEPVPLAWSETPTALQTGTIDGGDNGTSVILDMKFYEFADYLTILEHSSGTTPLLVSGRFMGRLDEDGAKAVRRAAIVAQAHQREILGAETEAMRQELVDEGMKMTRPDKTKFIEAAKTVQDNFASEKGEEFRSLLEKIRNTEG